MSQFARHGTIIDLTLRMQMGVRLENGNSKAAFFSTLHSFSQLVECSALYWGFQGDDRTRLVILVHWQGAAHSSGRPALPLDRLRPFIHGQARIYEVIFPDGLNSIGCKNHIRFSQHDPPSPYAIPGPELKIPQYTTHNLEESISSEIWVELQEDDRLCPVRIVHDGKPLPSWAPWTIKGPNRITTETPPSPRPGFVNFDLKVERYPVPWKRQTTLPATEEDEAEDLGWVFVGLETDELVSPAIHNPPTLINVPACDPSTVESSEYRKRMCVAMD